MDGIRNIATMEHCRVRRSVRSAARAAVWIALGLPFAGQAFGGSFELTPRHQLTFDSKVQDSAGAGEGVSFGVIPTHPVLIEHKLNQWNQFEEHVTPAVEHPVATLRATHVAVYRDRPDTSRLAMDQLWKLENEANVDADSKFALVANHDQAMLITLDKLELPQDRDDAWKIGGTSERLKLPEHIDDPIADRGRAVEGTLPLSGTIVFGKNVGGEAPIEFSAINVSNGAVTNLSRGHSVMLARDGTSIDCDMHHAILTDRNGKTLTQIAFDRGDITQFTIAPDGQRFALLVDRVVNVINAAHESAVEVYDIRGKKLGQIGGYDDPAFFPDGRLLLTGEGIEPGLYIGDVATGKAELLAVQDGPGGEAKVDYPKNPVVSPDGKWIAYEQRNHLIALVGVDGRGWQEVWNQTNNCLANPTFSPDSQFIAALVQEPDHWRSPGRINVFDVRKHIRQALPATDGASPDAGLIWMP